MGYIPTIRYVPSGNKAACSQHIKFAISQLAILDRQMEISNISIPGSINKGSRTRSPYPGVVVECVSSFGDKTIKIFVAPDNPVPVPNQDNIAVPIFKEELTPFGNVPIIAVMDTGATYLLYLEKDGAETTLKHPFSKATGLRVQNTSQFVQFRYEETAKNISYTLSIGKGISEITGLSEKSFVLLQKTTFKKLTPGSKGSIGGYFNIFKNPSDMSITHNNAVFIDSKAGREYSTSQVLFWCESAPNIANISEDKKTLYIIADANKVYIYEYTDQETPLEPETLGVFSWKLRVNGAVIGIPSGADYGMDLEYIDSYGYAYGVFNEVTVDNPDYIVCQAPDEYPGSSVEYKSSVETITKMASYKVAVEDWANGSFSPIEIDVKAHGPTAINTEFGPISTTPEYIKAGTNWGEYHVAITGTSPTPVSESTVVGNCGIFAIGTGTAVGAWVNMVNTYTTKEITFGPVSDQMNIAAGRGDLSLYNNGVEFHGENYAYGSTRAYYIEEHKYVGSFTEYSLQYIDIVTESDANLKTMWPMVYSGSVESYHNSAKKEIIEGVTFPLETQQDVSTRYGKCIEPFEIEDASPTVGFTCSDGNAISQSIYRSKSMFGLKYYTSSAPLEPEKWKIEIGGTDVTNELFVDKLVQSAEHPEDPSANTVEFLEETEHLRYICYLF